MSRNIPIAKHAPPASKVPVGVWITLAIVAPVVATLLCCGGFCMIGAVLDPKGGAGGGNQVQGQPQEAEKVTRENFVRMPTNMEFKEAVALLGPAQEDSRFGQMLNVSWRSRNGRCTIRATFEMAAPVAYLKGKSVYGD